MKKFILVIVSFSLIFLSNPSESVSVKDVINPTIRVCILSDGNNVRLMLKRGFKICAIDAERVLMEGSFLKTNVFGTKEGLMIGKKEVKLYGIRIKVSNDSNIYVNDRRFRGDIAIIKKENSRLMVINYIPLEDYLYGVLYHEVSHRWPMEALKAQAIAARTFALYQARQNRLEPYDLGSDIYSQVYGGSTSEKWATTKAVDRTKGEVLVYNGDIFPTYYHATCAGYTEDAANLWNVDLPPLKGVECNFCIYSPHYRWKKDIPLWELAMKLKQGGYNIGKINSVNILSRNKSGRADKIEIKDESGVSAILTAKEFRQFIGPNELRSTKFDSSIKWGYLVLNGFGWGHGVGMCQWGVYGMARKGKKAEEMLKYYYPGAEITTIDKIANKL